MAADLNSPSLRTFGWSISGGLDMDSNQYPDMLVGAYSSGHAVFMKAVPVIHMVAKLSFGRHVKQIDLEDQQCTLRDRTRVPCVQVSVSLRYTGVGVRNKLNFSLDYLLDSTKKEQQKRLFMLSQEGTSTRGQGCASTASWANRSRCHVLWRHTRVRRSHCGKQRHEKVPY